MTPIVALYVAIIAWEVTSTSFLGDSQLVHKRLHKGVAKPWRNSLTRTYVWAGI